MTVSRFGLSKSETRDFADRDRLAMSGTQRSPFTHEPTDWHTSNSAFLVALVAVGLFLAVLALALR